MTPDEDVPRRSLAWADRRLRRAHHRPSTARMWADDTEQHEAAEEAAQVWKGGAR